MDRLIKGIERDLKRQSKTEPKHKPKDKTQDHGEPEAKYIVDAEKQRHTEADAKRKAEGEKQHQAEAHAKRWKHPLTFAILALITGLVFWHFHEKIFSPPFKPESLRLGIYIKENVNTAYAVAAYSALIKQLNKSLADEFSGQDTPAYRFREEKIEPYTLVSRMEMALESGEVDVVGELSPYLVFSIGEKLNTTSLINPQYFGPNYSSVFFTRDSAEFIQRNGDEIDIDKSWSEFLKLLQENKGAMVAVARQESTSGYWYPRKELLKRVSDEKSFDDLAVPMDDSEKIRNAVCNGSQSVVAGAIAKFRFDDVKFNKTCPGVSRLVMLEEFGIIPHGAFVARKELYDDIVGHDRLHRFQRRWKEAVNELYKRTGGSIELGVGDKQLKLKDYFPRTWEARESSYYSEAKDVFTYPDKKADKKNRLEKLLLLIATLILLLGAVAYLKLRRAERA